MLHQNKSNSENGQYNQSVSHVSDWVEIRNVDTLADAADTAASVEDLLAIYKCFDFLERVWPTQPDSHQTAGPFTLEEEIGRGGMGRVWSAIQHEPVKRNVAVKLINPGPQTRQMVKRFESERSALALMNHPAIATLIDAGQTDDGQLYFAMELVDGLDLIRYCNQEQLSIGQRLNLFLDACSGVQHAHQKGIIHRDLKPSNILVGEVDDHARLKVIDFGLSKSYDTPQEITDEANSQLSQSPLLDATQDGQVIGSLKYMSPEQAAADLANIDVRSDVYSLGIVFFKLLTDSTPLETRGTADVPVRYLLDSIQHDTDLAPSEYLTALSKADCEKVVSSRQTSVNGYQRILKSDLDWIVMRATAKNPESRYQTVAEFASDIKRFLNHQPVLARPESLLYSVKKEVSKNRVLWASIAGIIIALLSGILISGYGLASANSARNLAEKRLAQSCKVNEILSAIFSDLDVQSVEMQSESFKVRVGRNLIEAAKGLNIESIGDPLEVADLKIKLTEALNSLEFFEEAVPISQETWASIGDFPAEQSDDLKYRAGIALAKALIGDGIAGEAMDILEPLYTDCRVEQGRDSETCLELLLLKGQAAFSMADDNLARRCFTDVANRREALWGKDDLRTLEAKSWLTEVYTEPGVAEANLPLADEVMAQYRRLLPEGHPRTIKAILNNAWIRSKAGDFKKTAQLANEGLALARKTYGENHPTTYDAKLVVGLFAHRNGKHQEGVRLLEEAWAGLSKTTGASHPRAIVALTILANISQQAGDLKRAISLMEEALAICPPRYAIEIDLADFHTQAGNFEIARKLLTTAMENAKGDHLEAETVSECMYLIGRTYSGEENYPEAIDAFEAAIELAPPTEERYHFPGMRKVLELARSHSQNGDHDEAVDIIDEYLDFMPASMGRENRVRLCCHAELGLILRRSGHTDEAMTELMSVARTGVILRHHDVLIHELRLAQAEKGQTEDILAGVNRELRFLRSTFPNDSIQGAIRLRRLGYNLIELQLPEKAKQVLTESAAIIEKASPGSWMLEKTKFDIAQLDFERLPFESDASLKAEIELEGCWIELAEMRSEVFPNKIWKLADSIKAVIRAYEGKADGESAAIWQERLETCTNSVHL